MAITSSISHITTLSTAEDRGLTKRCPFCRGQGKCVPTIFMANSHPSAEQKIRILLYLISHYCAKCCGWSNFLFLVVVSYAVFLGRRYTW